MKHTEGLSVMQVKVTWDIVLFLPGMNAKKSTMAAVHRSARKRLVMVMFSVLMSVLVLACGAVIWICKEYR